MKRLLYAEDEYTNRKIMEIQCRKAGVDCLLAEDGPAALEMMADQDFDLAILDLYMPGINGDALVKEARKRGITYPLVAITSDDSMTEHLLACGFDDVYIKPLHSADYRKIIETFIP